jgi:hypothetical protein
VVSHLKILSDLTEIRSQLRDHGSAHQHLLRLNLARPSPTSASIGSWSSPVSLRSGG